jgi:hypothetical protein
MRAIRAYAAAVAIAAMAIVPVLMFAIPPQHPAAPRLARGFEPPPAKASAPAAPSIRLTTNPSPVVLVLTRVSSDSREPLQPHAVLLIRSHARRGPPAVLA